MAKQTKYTIVIDKQPRENPSNERREYTITCDELLKKGEVCDTLKIEKGIAKIIRRVGITKAHETYVLDKEVEESIGKIELMLFEGTNYIYIKDIYNNNISVSYIIKNDFTDTYITNVEMYSAINQSAEEIELSVNKKLEGYDTSEEINSKIEQKADSITSTVSKNYATKEDLNTTKSEIKQTTDSITSSVSKKVGKDEIISKINQSAEAVSINADKIDLKGKQIDLTGDNVEIKSDNFNVASSGKMTCSNVNITGGSIKMNVIREDQIIQVIKNENEKTYMSLESIGVAANNANVYMSCANGMPIMEVTINNKGTHIRNYEVESPFFNDTSLEKIKKNIVKFDRNALEIIKDGDIYLYNLKSEDDTDKQHLGFVIGEKYKTPKEVLSKSGESIELYSTCSLLWKAVQELTKEIELLKEEKRCNGKTQS